jgi:N-acetyl-gamma-glutamyl-phosphate reductase
VPEIERFAGLSRRPIFIPSVGHFRQGMLVSVPLYLDDLPGRPTGADLREVLRAFYEGSEYVTVAAGTGADKLEPEALNGTNRLDLYVCANDACRQAVLVAQLDNLGKGASGAAVQNLRLMLDLDPAPS